jgi:hypothetical protein
MLWGEEVSTGQNRARAGNNVTKFLCKAAKSFTGQATEEMVEPVHSNIS